jgi:alkylation response protein AidB-like acyl-CoA dehydrogenase
MYLTEEHTLVQEMARKFAQERIAPGAAERDKNEMFPKEILTEMGQLGLLGVVVPNQWDGAGMDYLSLSLVTEEVAAADGGLSTILCVQSMVQAVMMSAASDAQKEQWLKPMARGEAIGAFGLTEPQAGSDASSLQTTAVWDGDHYVLNGTKHYITSGKNGDVTVVFAVTDRAAGKKGISAFIVPQDTPGYEVVHIEDKMGQHCSDTAQIALTNARVPAANLLGKEGEGYKIALSNLEAGRISVASQALGMARAAYDVAVRYAKERMAFGKPIIEHQAVAFRLADMATALDAARLMVHRAAVLRQQGKPCLKEACMAKLMATEAAERICHDAIQTLGGAGYTADFPVERIYRDVRVCKIYEGTSDIQKIVISNAIARE